jgi:FtsP/CotA-like multicopper oxidase with cupredoxin domain
VPTDSAASPLTIQGRTAEPFTQPMLRFEEFGLKPMPKRSSEGKAWSSPAVSLPMPDDEYKIPAGPSMDAHLRSPLYPEPTRKANESFQSPWKSRVEEYLGRELDTPPVEGRPGGEWWAHQRWEEFYPQEYFQTVQTGARKNSGFRNDMQRHGYATAEFGPGGLHYLPQGTSGIELRFHPELPIQDPQAVWTFDGTIPPKLLTARYGTPILFRHYNALPIDESANYGFGSHTISTHEHNGHNPSESDGYAGAYFYPGQFYDYHWPMILAGHDSINVRATDARAAVPDENSPTGTRRIRGDYRETMSTHWFHDHMLDYTAQNVYKGNAAMMNYYSAIDRGNEALEDGVNLRFPSGSDLDWGNRDYDVNLLLAPKAWDADGQLKFNIFNTDGFLADRFMVNLLYKPYLDVRARRYRFRILNASVSRYMTTVLVDESGNRMPFYMIANDGNILEHAVYFDGSNDTTKGELPTQGIAERYDIIIDFSQFEPGRKLYFVNLLEHRDGKGPNEKVDLEEVLSGDYDCDPAVGKFLEFRVHAYKGKDLSMNPAHYVAGKKKMLRQPTFTDEELANAVHREFKFGRSSGSDGKPWTIKTNGGDGYGMNEHRVSASIAKEDSSKVRANPANKNLSLGEAGTGAVEIWHLDTGGGWAHPIHVHFEEGKILSRDGEDPPSWEKWGRKDVYRIGDMPDSGRSVDFAVRFREFGGTYMEHCHNTQHEDVAMLLRWDIDNPGELIPLPTPHVGWDGTTYEDSFALENGTWRKGDEDAADDYSDEGGGSTDDGWCDVDWNDQVDHRDIRLIRDLVANSAQHSVVLTSQKGQESEFTALDAEACELECTHRFCGTQELKCGLVGLESLVLLVPLGLRRLRKRGPRAA